MSNLEVLDLTLTVSATRGLIDGTELMTNILDHLPRVNRFTFNIRSYLMQAPHVSMPTTEEVQKTFVALRNNNIVSYVDYQLYLDTTCCLAYTTPYTMKFYEVVTNRFPGGLFPSVRRMLLCDGSAFEHDFFLRVSLSFPLVQCFRVQNSRPQQNQYSDPVDDARTLPIIKWPHLINLGLVRAHADYVEQFLVDTRTLLPDTVHLNVCSETLQRVTHDYSRDAMRSNCARLREVLFADSPVPFTCRQYFPRAKVIQ